MSKLAELQQAIVAFRDERNWKQFHNPKDSAISLVLEATEVMEHFQWKNGEEVETYVKTHKQEIGEELADTLYWVLLMSHELGIDIIEVSHAKLKKNAEKYPVEKARGSNKKYNQL